MKKSILARGFIGSVASLLGVVAMGCSGEVADEATAGNGEIGSVEQAIAIANLDAPSVGMSYAEAKFPGYFQIPGTKKVLVLGGYDSAGNASSKVLTFEYNTANNPPEVWSDAMADLPAGRAEFEVVAFPGTTKLALIGGRTSTTGTPLDTIVIYDYSGTGSANLATGTLATGRVNFQAVPCKSQVLAIGGDTGSGVENKLEVITLAASPNFATVATLKDDTAAPNTRTVTLKTSRMFHSSIALDSDSKILTVAGENGSLATIGSSERIDINASGNCVAANATIDANGNTTILDALPSSETRSRGFIGPVSLSVSGNTHQALFGAGFKNVSGTISVPVATYAYRVSTDTWAASGVDLGASRGRMRPTFVPVASGTFALIGGDNDTSLSGAGAVNLVDSFASNTWSTATMTEKRLGAWGALLDSTYIAGHGSDTTQSPEAFLSTPE